jgi:hypothetical protein
MKKLFLIALCLAVCIFYAGGAWAAEFCVTNASELLSALNIATTNAASNLIKVVQGTYAGHFTYYSTAGHSIELQGGYTAACAGRVVNPANTILDGGGSGRVLYLLTNTNGGNMTVDGFTIQNGSTDAGGGISANSNSDSVTSGDITLTNNTITANAVTTTGGGVLAASGSNSGTAGNVTLTNNTIFGNTAGGNAGGVWATSYSASSIAGTVTLTNNTITGNTSVAWGGGGYLESGSTSGTANNVTLNSNTITGNIAGGHYGGGVYAHSSSQSGAAGTVILTSNIVMGNTSVESGGGVYASSYATMNAGDIILTNNIIAGNTATSVGGGGGYLYSYSTSGTAGNITLTNNTVTGNSSPGSTARGGGIFLQGDNNNAYVYNNIFWGNTATFTGNDIYQMAGTPNFVAAYSSNNDYNYNNVAVNWTSQVDNINVDPLFVGSGNYHLSPTSPCIDAGLNSAPSIPSTDFEGDNRIIDGNQDTILKVDIGADEYNPCGKNTFKIGDTIASYSSIYAAYEAMSSGTMEIHEFQFSEILLLNLGKTVTLKGGYDCNFGTNSGSWTTINGSMTVSNGNVTLENIIIK